MDTNRQEQFITFYSLAGHLLRVRPLRSEDAPQLVAIFENMSPESRFRRFHQTMDNVSPARVREEAMNIVQADSERNWGLIAFTDDGRQQNVPIGAVRLVRSGAHEAEVAISVRDDFHNLGIGSQLMLMLATGAREMGILRLVADIQNDNPAIWHVFKKLPFSVKRVSEGTHSHIIVDLAGHSPASP